MIDWPIMVIRTPVTHTIQCIASRSSSCNHATPTWGQYSIILHTFAHLLVHAPQVLEDNIKATIKPQYVDHIPRAVRGLVGKVLKAKDERTEAEGFDALEWAVEKAELGHVMDRDIGVLSGGELQRFAIAAVAVQSSDVYMFDEPSSYLDVKQVRMCQKCLLAEAVLLLLLLLLRPHPYIIPTPYLKYSLRSTTAARSALLPPT